MGIDVNGHKMLAFALGGGSPDSRARSTRTSPSSSAHEFGFDRGVDILTMTILGGTDGLTGPVLGAVIVTLLPELLRGFHDYRADGQRRDPGPDRAVPAEGAVGPGWFRGMASTGRGRAMSDLLTLNHVSRHFGGLNVLQDVTFEVRAGTSPA